MAGKKRKQAQDDGSDPRARTVRLDDLIVFVRCVAVGDEPEPRQQVSLECNGRVAVLEVPGGPAAEVSRAIDEAVGIFAASLRLVAPI